MGLLCLKNNKKKEEGVCTPDEGYYGGTSDNGNADKEPGCEED